jgi:hypothetical protein
VRSLRLSFIAQRDASCRCNPADGWLTYLGGRPRCPSTSGSQVGSHCRPTSGHMEPMSAFDSLALPGIQTQLDTSADVRNLVRIEVIVSSDSPPPGPDSSLSRPRGCGLGSNYIRDRATPRRSPRAVSLRDDLCSGGREEVAAQREAERTAIEVARVVQAFPSAPQGVDRLLPLWRRHGGHASGARTGGRS